MLSNIFGAIMELFGFARGRQSAKNAPEVQAAARGATDQELKDSAAKAIAERDTEEVRRRLSE